MEDLTGKMLDDYYIAALLGQGGMATVYKAYQSEVDRHVAIKVISPHFANDPNFTQRFEQEAKVVAKLQHPHILPLYNYGQAEGLTYIVMPLIDGGDLADLMLQEHLGLARINKIISEIGDALDYAHAQGVVHRDIKPTNIMLDKRGNSLLTDFGLARILEERSSRLTASGYVVGTPVYMSPEQGMGEKLDGRSDIYSLGVVLYELATGKAPYESDTPLGVIYRHINDPLPAPRELNPEIPEPLAKVITTAMAKRPEDRFATAGEMVGALQRAIGTNPSLRQAAKTSVEPHLPSLKKTRLVAKNVSAKPATTPRNTESTRFNLWLISGIAVVLLIFLAGVATIVGLWYFSQQSSPNIPAVAPQPTITEPPTPSPSPTPQPTETPPPTPVPTAVVPPTEPPQSPPAEATTAPSSQLPSATAPPPQPPPGPGRPPPLEAIEACRNATEGTACQFNTVAGESLSGLCRSVPQNQLACVPQ